MLRAAKAKGMGMQEQVFLKEAGWLVTSARIEIDGQTFAVRNVGSVKVDTAGRPWAAFVLGVLGAAAMTANPFFGVPMLLLAGYLFWQNVSERSLVLVTGGGEQVALKSRNGAVVERLRAAVADAIAAR